MSFFPKTFEINHKIMFVNSYDVCKFAAYKKLGITKQ